MISSSFAYLRNHIPRTHVSIRLRRRVASGISFLSFKQRKTASCNSPASNAWFKERGDRWSSLGTREIDRSATFWSRLFLLSNCFDFCVFDMSKVSYLPKAYGSRTMSPFFQSASTMSIWLLCVFSGSSVTARHNSLMDHFCLPSISNSAARTA